MCQCCVILYLFWDVKKCCLCFSILLCCGVTHPNCHAKTRWLLCASMHESTGELRRNTICRSTLFLQTLRWKRYFYVISLIIIGLAKGGVWVHVIRRDEQEGVFVVTRYTVLCRKHSQRQIIFRLVHQRKSVAHAFTRHQSVPSRLSFGSGPAPERESRKDRQLAARSHRNWTRWSQVGAEAVFEVKSVEGDSRTYQTRTRPLVAELAMMKSQLFRYENIKDYPEQLPYVTGLSLANLSCLW